MFYLKLSKRKKKARVCNTVNLRYPKEQGKVLVVGNGMEYEET
jgi:hypothetical protein